MINNSLTVVEFKPEHLENISLKEIHSGEIPKAVTTYALTILDKETPLAIFGGFFFVPGIIHFWGLVSDDVRKKPIAFHKMVRHLLEFYENRDKPRRMQIDVKADYLEGKKWAKSLGFELEGTMKNYGVNGEDFHLYGRAL